MRNVLVTGATGFVGRHLLDALARNGVQVRAVVRAGREPVLEGHPAVQSIVATPSLFHEDEAWWGRVAEGMDTVIHAAWYAVPGQYLHAPENLDCLSGTLIMSRGCLAAGVGRFVGIGTCFEYDLSAGDLSPETPLRPQTLYAAAKMSAYACLSNWLPAAGIEFAWCRLFYLHGPGEDERRFVPYLRACLSAGKGAALTSGNQIRDYIDVRDAASRIVDIALGLQAGPFNICSGVPVTIRDLALEIAAEYGRPDLLNFGARPDNSFDPPRIVGIP